MNSYSTLAQLFESQVERQPHAPALIWQQTELSYIELNSQANQVAHFLRSQGVGPDVPVGVCLERGVQMIVAIIAVIKAGGCYLPLDPDYPEERLSYMLKQSQCVIVLSESGLLEELQFLSSTKTFPLDGVFYDALFSGQPYTNPSALVLDEEARNLAYIIYTSGSTGVPKGTAVSQGNVISLVLNDFVDFERNKVVLCAASPSFDAFTFELWGALLHGGCSVLVSLKQLDFNQLSESIKLHKIQCAWLTAAIFNQIMDSDSAILQGLDTLLIGGEALSKEHVQCALKELPDLKLINGYGPTECTTFACTQAISEHHIRECSSVPIGQAITNTVVYVLNEHGVQVESGLEGELCIGGAGVSRGYVANPSLTSTVFIPNPFAATPGERLYLTGDRVKQLADGKIVYLGRVDDQVKIRGFRIELGEIETQLKAHEWVKQAVVVLQENNGGKSLIAYIVTDSAAHASDIQQTLLPYMQSSLPDYMVPQAFVALAELPLSVNGKVNKYALPKVDDTQLIRSRYVSAETPLELQLARLWQHNLSMSDIGVNENYLAMGGDSIRAISLVTQARKEGIPLSIKLLFSYPTIKELAGALLPLQGNSTHSEDANRQILPFALLTPQEKTHLQYTYSADELDDAYPLSQVQQGMLYHSMQSQELSLYHDIVSYQIDTTFEHQRWADALALMIKNHEILRSVFSLHYGRPLQLVLSANHLTFNSYDLTQDGEQTSTIRRWFEQEKQLGFDTCRELLRIAVFKLSSTQVQVALSFHHAMWDGWSDAVFVKQWLTAADQGAQFTETLAPSYKFFIADEQAAMNDSAMGAFWQEKLVDVSLPWWSHGCKSHSEKRDWDVPELYSTKIMALANGMQVQEKSIWSAIYLTLIALLDGNDCALGSIVTHTRPEIEGGDKTLGLFLNSLPILADISGLNWRALITKVNQQITEHYQVRQFPVAEIQRLCGIDFSASLFNYINFHVHSDQQDQAAIRSDIGFVETNYLFSLNVRKSEDGRSYSAQISADSGIFNKPFRDRIDSYLQNIVVALSETPDQKIDRLALIGEQELHRLQFEWNNRQTASVEGDSVGLRIKNNTELAHQLIEKQVVKSPSSIALVEGSCHLSFGELNRRANRLAGYLRQRDIGTESRVGICLPRSLEMGIALLGTLKAGAAYVPINPADPIERINYIIKDAGIELLLTFADCDPDLNLLSLVDSADVPLLFIDRFEQVEPGAEHDNNPCQDSRLEGASLAYIIYTSGSSGVPKGVMVEHRSLARHCAVTTQMRGFDASTRNLQFAPLAFDAATAEFLNAFISGSLLHLPQQDILTDHLEFERYVWQRRINRGYIPPAFLPLLDKENFKQYVSMSVGGEAVARETIFQWSQICPVTNAYGPTECTIAATSGICHSEETVSIGRPLSYVQAYVVGQDMNILPTGVAGELYIGGEGVSRGYVNNPGLSADKFIPDPFSSSPGARLYKSGDRVRWLDDGKLEFMGRIDQQVKLRGYRIELEEIETCLKKFEQVTDAAVVVQAQGTPGQRLSAFVVANKESDDETKLLGHLKIHLRNQLPGYMIPSHFERLEVMPFTANGKIDRNVLRATEINAQTDDCQPTQGVTEKKLGEIWHELLNIRNVSRHANFFDVGGHSLLATQLLSRVRAQFELELSIRTLFANPTIAALAKVIEDEGVNDIATFKRPQLRPAQNPDLTLQLSFAQQRLWFLSQLTGPDATYNIPLALRLQGQLDTQLLGGCLNTLLQRHQAFRSRFVAVKGEPQLVIDPFITQQFSCELIADAEQLKSLCQQEQQYLFDLANDTLVRIRLLKEADNSHVLLVTMHHIISDGWSLSVFFNELTLLYTSAINGQENPLAALTVEYSDYARWQSDWLSGEVLVSQFAYWKKQLSSLPPLLALPSDRARPAQQTFQGGSSSFTLPQKLVLQLTKLSQVNKVTLFTTLFSAFSLLLQRYSRQNDFAIGVPVANRTMGETEQLIGFFVNTLVMRCEMSDEDTFIQLLNRHHRTALDAFSNQDVPFEQLVSELNPQRSLSHSPLFQVMFTLQNAQMQTATLPELEVSSIKLHEFGVSRFDLTLYLGETTSGIDGNMEFNTDLFDRQSIELMVAHFSQLLSSIVAQPTKRLSEFDITTIHELQLQLQHRWQSREEKTDVTLDKAFAQHVSRQHDAPALFYADQHLSYGEVELQANQLCKQITDLGGLLPLTIGIMAHNPVTAAIACLAVVKLGLCYVVLSPALPGFKKQGLIEQTKVKLLLVDSQSTASQLYGVTCLNMQLQNKHGYFPSPALSVSCSNPLTAACVTCIGGNVGIFTHLNLACIKSASSSAEFSLVGLDPFSRHLWWNWINGQQVDLNKLASNEAERRIEHNQSLPFSANGIQIKVLVNGKPVHIGGVGELVLAGQALPYIESRDTEELFTPQLPTGILVRIKHDGSLAYWGESAKQQQKQQRFSAIKRLLQLLQSDKKNIGVVVVERERALAQGKSLCVYLERRQAKASDVLSELKALLKSQTPAYLLPNFALVMPAFPRMNTGEIDLDSLPFDDAVEQSVECAPPENETEQGLARIWCEVLKREQVGRGHNFFDLGGYSLLVTQIASRIYERFQLSLSVKTLFEHQTIEAQAKLITSQKSIPSPSSTRIARLDANELMPLSYAQQRLWFLWTLMGPSPVYNVPLVLRLAGELDVAKLQLCLQAIISRHDILRTRFEYQGGAPVQRVEPPANLLLEVEWVNGAIPQEEIIKAEREYEFDLVNEIPLRIRLLQSSQQQHLLLVTMHHILTDGWSTDIFLNELQIAYTCYLSDVALPFAPLSIQYGDYAAWQRDAFTELDQKHQLQYWREQLTGLPPLLELPTDYVRPAEQSNKGSVEKLTLDPELSSQLRQFSRSNNATLFMTLMSAFSLLLSRYARQTDIAVGTPVVNRNNKQTEDLMGFFLNSLVIRCDLSKDPSFEEYIQQIRATTLEAYEHQELPFEHLVESVNPERSLSHTPLFQVSFSLVNNPIANYTQNGLDITVVMPEEGYEGVSRYDITFNLADRGKEIVGAMEYNTDLFKPSTIRRMQAQYIQLLRAIVADPKQRVFDLGLSDPTERALLLKQCNDTQRDYPQAASVPQLFEHQVSRSPFAIAATYQQQSISYDELNRRANQVAHSLRAAGVGPEVCVGLCMERSLDMLVGLLAILKAGGCYVVLDPEYPEIRLQYMLAQTHCQMVLTETELMTELEWLTECQTLALDSGLHQAVFGAFSDSNIEGQDIGLTPANRAYIIYTSGSTGNPKGVVITHDNITSLVCSQNSVQQTDTDVVVQASNHSFDAFTYEMWGAFLNGARLLLIDKSTLLQPSLLADTLVDEGASILFITTAMFNRINQDAPHAFSGLKKLLFGGEAFSIQAIETALNVGCPEQLHHVYGPTECTTYATGQLLSKTAFRQDKKAPIGFPLANNTAYVINNHQLAPLGTIGELWIGGQGLGRGYLNDAGLTAEKFVPNPFSQIIGERLYRTGDLVRQLANGSIDFVGRVDHQVKIRGFRIELSEIEAALSAFSEVKEVVVVVRQTCAEDRHLVAYLVLNDPDVNVDQLKLEIIEQLQRNMPDYVVPKALVVLAKLPLNSNGKVDRKALPEPEESAFSRVQYRAPSNAIEQALVEVWQAVIGLQKIGVGDNFFAIGGDSIRSISVVAQCKERGLGVAVKDLFANPTIAALASVVSQVDKHKADNQELAAFSLLSEEESDSLMQDFAAEDF